MGGESLIEGVLVWGFLLVSLVAIAVVTFARGRSLIRKAQALAPLWHTVEELKAQIEAKTKELEAMLGEWAKAKQDIALADEARKFLQEYSGTIAQKQEQLKIQEERIEESRRRFEEETEKLQETQDDLNARTEELNKVTAALSAAQNSHAILQQQRACAKHSLPRSRNWRPSRRSWRSRWPSRRSSRRKWSVWSANARAWRRRSRN